MNKQGIEILEYKEKAKDTKNEVNNEEEEDYYFEEENEQIGETLEGNENKLKESKNIRKSQDEAKVKSDFNSLAY